MKKYFLLPLIVLLGFYSGCSNNHQKSKQQAISNHPKKNGLNYHKKNFDSLMLVDKNLRLDIYEGLLMDTAFVSVLEHSPVYLTDAITFLAKGDFTPMQAEVCICAMQNLKINDYVRFCKVYMSLYEKHKLSDQLIKDVISPDFLKKRIIINNYDNPGVVAILKSILDNEQFSDKDFKKYILNDILTGKAEKDLKAFDEANE